MSGASQTMGGYTKVYIGYGAYRIPEEPHDAGLTPCLLYLLFSPGSDWAHWAPRTSRCQWREGELWLAFCPSICLTFVPLSTNPRMSSPYLLPDSRHPSQWWQEWRVEGPVKV